MENDQLINKPSFRLLPFSWPGLRPGHQAETGAGGWGGVARTQESIKSAGSHQTVSALSCPWLYLPVCPLPSGVAESA